MRTPKNWVTPFTLKERTLVISFPKPRVAISSAVLGGGIKNTQVIINHQVDQNASVVGTSTRKKRIHDNPQSYLKRIIRRLTGRGSGIGLMTAVDLRHLLLKRVQSGPLWVEGFFTVGITNAVCVGEPVSSPKKSEDPHVLGTINMILVSNVSLPVSALVGAVGVAVESKTAAMLEQNIESWTGKKGATGTGTDSMVWVSGFGPRLSYSGTHTKLGELIGRVVRVGVKDGLQRIKRSTLE